MHARFPSDNEKEGGHLGDVCVDGGIISILILKLGFLGC
jgi:hypothetical protein